MTCPYLEYREASGERSFDVARGYCTAAGQFVQPMRADVCNDRYDLDHAEHCEIFLAHAPADDDVPDPDGPAAGGADPDQPGDGRTDTDDEGDPVSDPDAANEAMPRAEDEADGAASRGEGEAENGTSGADDAEGREP